MVNSQKMIGVGVFQMLYFVHAHTIILTTKSQLSASKRFQKRLNFVGGSNSSTSKAIGIFQFSHQIRHKSFLFVLILAIYKIRSKFKLP